MAVNNRQRDNTIKIGVCSIYQKWTDSPWLRDFMAPCFPVLPANWFQSLVPTTWACIIWDQQEIPLEKRFSSKLSSVHKVYNMFKCMLFSLLVVRHLISMHLREIMPITRSKKIHIGHRFNSCTRNIWQLSNIIENYYLI